MTALNKQTIRPTRVGGKWGAATALLLCGVALSGCHIDMWNQSKMKPFYQSDFFADQSADRPLVEHTVPVGPIEAAKPDYFTGFLNGKPVAKIPVSAVKSFESPKAMLLQGQIRYNAYCTPCHGKTGDGNGFIMQRGLGYWQKLAASYHTARLRKIEDGHIYDVITNGYGVMYAYGARIQDVNDRWAIVAYVRALQLARASSPPAPDPYATKEGIAAGATTTPIAPSVPGQSVTAPVPTPVAPATPIAPRIGAPHTGGAPNMTTAPSPIPPADATPLPGSYRAETEKPAAPSASPGATPSPAAVRATKP